MLEYSLTLLASMSLCDLCRWVIRQVQNYFSLSKEHLFLTCGEVLTFRVNNYFFISISVSLFMELSTVICFSISDKYRFSATIFTDTNCVLFFNRSETIMWMRQVAIKRCPQKALCRDFLVNKCHKRFYPCFLNVPTSFPLNHCADCIERKCVKISKHQNNFF